MPCASASRMKPPWASSCLRRSPTPVRISIVAPSAIRIEARRLAFMLRVISRFRREVTVPEETIASPWKIAGQVSSARVKPYCVEDEIRFAHRGGIHHDKVGAFNHDLFPGFWGDGPLWTVLGADAPA